MPETIISLPEAVQLLADAVAAILVAGFAGAPITLFVVATLKRFVPVDSGVLQFVVAIVLTLLFWLAQYFGYEAQFRSIVDFVMVSGPALLALLTTLFGSSALYHSARRNAIPVAGYSRSTPAVG